MWRVCTFSQKTKKQKEWKEWLERSLRKGGGISTNYDSTISQF